MFEPFVLQPGDLIVMKGNSIFSKLTRFVTRSTYTHVCLSVGWGVVLDVDGFRKAAIRELSESNGFIVMRSRVPLNSYQQQRIRIIAEELVLETKGYDWVEALGLLMRRLGASFPFVGSPKRHLCTELCLEALCRVGVEIEALSLEPDDLLVNPKLLSIMEPDVI